MNLVGFTVISNDKAVLALHPTVTTDCCR